jgi:hypothetical protein
MGWLPVVLSDYADVSFDCIPLYDVWPARKEGDRPPILPLPPAGELQQDYLAY